jgi:hypothetical protein
LPCSKRRTWSRCEWRGREKLHFLNPVPLQEIYDRWICKFERPRLKALRDLKRRLEEDGED